MIGVKLMPQITPEEELVSLLKDNELTISTAESCTGGMVASMLVNVAGASEVFQYGYVTYSDEAKQKTLGVPADMLSEFGAVSEEVAKEMAQRCRALSESSVAVATTGYAGPADSADEPKGLVYIACATEGDIAVLKCKFTGDRNEIRQSAAYEALELVKAQIEAAYR